MAWLLKNHRDLIDAEYCINVDSGDFQARGGKTYIVTVAAGEKKETILELETTNRGGHGSLPRKDNAIYELTAALEKIERLQFPALLNDVTRAEFSAIGSLESGQQSTDLKALSHDPADPAAIERLSKDPYYNALLRTTCVATMLEAGHGPSALPQRAKAVVNCRLIPGFTSDQVLTTMHQTIADDQVRIGWQFNEDLEPLASPLRPDVFSAVNHVKDHLWPQAIVMPGLDTGGSDGRFLRAAGIPTYGLAGIFIEQGDNRLHGRDERVRVSDFYNGLTFYDDFVKALVGTSNN
jgi:acetylornithine deacetylase/succinyl-diaminopimelate desuccinylase-like protein